MSDHIHTQRCYEQERGVCQLVCGHEPTTEWPYEVTPPSLLSRALNAEAERDAYRADIERALDMLESALGKRPGSVVEGVRDLTDRCREYEHLHDEFLAESQAVPQAATAAIEKALSEARRQGAEQERARWMHAARALGADPESWLAWIESREASEEVDDG